MTNEVRARRTDRGWTQAQLADLAGVSRQTINAIEADRYDPSLPLAFTLARIFDEPIEQLFHADHSAAIQAS